MNMIWCFLFGSGLGYPPAVPNGYTNPTRYLVFFLIPARFSFENRRVAGNQKYRVLPDIFISGKPKILGIS